jgi:hypothetical protein
MICVFGLACIFTTGCEKMEKPVMDVMDMAMTETEMDTETETPAETDMTAEMEAPMLPEDFEALPDDNVVHVTELSPGAQVRLNEAGEVDIKGELHVYDTLIFDLFGDAVESSNDGVLSKVWEWWLLQREGACKDDSIVDKSMTMYFTHPHREDRDGYAEELSQISQVSTSVVILNNAEVYYAISVDPGLDALDAICE